MRATSMRRLIGGAAALMLVGAMLLTAGGVTAGQTRILDIRSPGELDAGALSFTPVSPGGATKTDVVVTNNGKQNLTKAHLLIGGTDGVALPDTISVADVFGLSGAGTCTFTAATVDCDYGSLTSKGAGKTRQVSIAFNVGATTPPSPIVITIKVAENVQDVGSNQNFQQATGTPTVDGPSCHGYATYILSVHDALTLAGTSTDCTGQDQVSSLLLQKDSGNGFAKFDDLTPAVCTIGNLTCFGNEVSATVHNGDTILPYLTWKITYSASLLGNINASKVAFQHGTAAPITFKKNTCGAPEDFTSDCIVVPFTPNPDGSVTFEIRTKTNSTIRGVH
jgi:hypothetical protein